MLVTLASFRSSPSVARWLLSFQRSEWLKKKKPCACSNHYKSKSSWEDQKQETSATSDITDCDRNPPFSPCPSPSQACTLVEQRGDDHRETASAVLPFEAYFSPKNFLQKSAASALVIRKLSPWKCPPGKMALISASMWLKISESLVRFRLHRRTQRVAC